jgi:hypothetical protein
MGVRPPRRRHAGAVTAFLDEIEDQSGDDKTLVLAVRDPSGTAPRRRASARPAVWVPGDELATGDRAALSRGGRARSTSCSTLEQVLKRFHDAELARASDLEERLRAMVAHRPAWQETSGTHDARLAVRRRIRREPLRRARHATAAAGRGRRAAQSWPTLGPAAPAPPPGWVRGFTWRHLVRTGANLALATDVLHRSDYVVGDFNERNILVRSDTRVTLVDCDSMQVPNPRSGLPFLCGVGRAEFTAPELLDVDIATTPRRASSDLFALAVHIFQLVMEGVHPFDGVWHGDGEKPRRHQLAQQGLFAYAGDPPAPAAHGHADLPPEEIREPSPAFVSGAADPDVRPGPGMARRARPVRRGPADAARSSGTCIPAPRDPPVVRAEPVGAEPRDEARRRKRRSPGDHRGPQAPTGARRVVTVALGVVDACWLSS